ncbi:MAG: hypothetical protein WBP93_10365 [Pyrinomonadaceae bacterium]
MMSKERKTKSLLFITAAFLIHRFFFILLILSILLIYRLSKDGQRTCPCPYKYFF